MRTSTHNNHIESIGFCIRGRAGWNADFGVVLDVVGHGRSEENSLGVGIVLYGLAFKLAQNGDVSAEV
jgi:hypothetical protein